ncbi:MULTISPECIES: hypothetical protein [Mesorhizobium]|uniref:Uncharacterized protein n=1 Tax=Mesorhizobium shonense TaxID=1209948 RepID=A0ABV2HLP7_9HYPH|nr:hypothetical protein [Mesorhizobium sp.]RWA78289.1 MAG: hypothetical protein EOQ30_30205 [Mesorhizobium sp.]
MGQPLPPGKLKTKAGPRHFPIEALQPNQFDGQTYLAVRKLLDFEGQMEKTAKPISTIDPAFATRPADFGGRFSAPAFFGHATIGGIVRWHHTRGHRDQLPRRPLNQLLKQNGSHDVFSPGVGA